MPLLHLPSCLVPASNRLLLGKAFVFLVALMVCYSQGGWCLADEAIVLVEDSTVSGHQIIYVTEHALKIDNDKLGATILCTAPNWDVFIYNRRSHRFFETTADKFKASFFQALTSVYGEGLCRLVWDKEGPTSLSGVPAIKYVCIPKLNQEIKLRKIAIKEGHYWIASKLVLPASAYHVLAKIDSLPLLPGLPLAVNYTAVDGKTDSTLTLKSTRKITVSSTDFARPKGYAKAKSERDVFIDDAGQSAIEDMFR